MTRTTEPRNETFDSDHKPFDDKSSLSFLGATGTFKFLNPTSAQYSWSGWNPSCDHPSTSGGQQEHSGNDNAELEGHLPEGRKDDVLSFVWRSRDNRKGRDALVLRRGEDGQELPHGSVEPTNSLSATLRGIGALFTIFPYWDISWCVAIVYTLGSLVWVANGLTGVLPLVGLSSSKDLKLANTWTAFIGALIFFLGSYMLFLEAVNANQKGCFGWAVERIVRGVQPEAEVHPGDCDHHYHTKDNHTHTDEIHNSIHEDVIGNDEFENVSGRDDGHDEPNANHSGSQERMLSMDNEETDHHPYKWSWWPSWRDLQRHFFYEIGFLACAIQLVSGSLFWLTKFTTLPGITEHIG